MLSKKKRQTDTPSAQWVLVGPASLADPPAAKQQDGGGDGPLFVRLRHPSTGDGALFLLSCSAQPQQLWEVKAFQEQYHSWLIGQAVQHDGRLLYATPMDPLFLGLPYLSRAAQGQAKFQPVDQLLVDEDFPACSMLSRCPRLLQALHQLTDEKQIGSKKFYKYSQEKTLQWLKKKVEQTTGALRKNNVCVGAGVQSATFIRSKPGSEAQEEEDYLRYAHGLIADYIPQELSEALAKHLSLPQLARPPTKTPVQKRKRGDEGRVEAREDYTKENLPIQKSKVPNGKMSAAQKSLAKVDKTGMKSMSSFFTPKSKGAK